MRTSTDLPLCRFTTLIVLPNGRVLCAAVRRSGSNVSPLAVRPGCSYHDARPVPTGRPACLLGETGSGAVKPDRPDRSAGEGKGESSACVGDGGPDGLASWGG